MVLAITSVFAWATVGSGGGELNGGALGCPPGVHAMGVHGTSVQQHRPSKIVHTLNFVGHVRERPLIIGFDTFNELDVLCCTVTVLPLPLRFLLPPSLPLLCTATALSLSLLSLHCRLSLYCTVLSLCCTVLPLYCTVLSSSSGSRDPFARSCHPLG